MASNGPFIKLSGNYYLGKRLYPKVSGAFYAVTKVFAKVAGTWRGTVIGLKTSMLCETSTSGSTDLIGYRVGSYGTLNNREFSWDSIINAIECQRTGAVYRCLVSLDRDIPIPFSWTLKLTRNSTGATVSIVLTNSSPNSIIQQGDGAGSKAVYDFMGANLRSSLAVEIFPT